MSEPQRRTAIAPAQMMCCYQPSASIIFCEGRTVTAPDPVAELCRVLLRAGFQPDTGLVIRQHEIWADRQNSSRHWRPGETEMTR